jgi:NAD(P)-dependent dehydrogenase (short-subunit alcohol dehydrogenase family)
MISDFKGKTAVLTGAGSGFGLECARIGAQLGMNLVLVDVQPDALDAAAAEMTAVGAPVLARRGPGWWSCAPASVPRCATGWGR